MALRLAPLAIIAATASAAAFQLSWRDVRRGLLWFSSFLTTLAPCDWDANSGTSTPSSVDGCGLTQQQLRLRPETLQLSGTDLASI
jgi:hypothetical protein